MIPFDRVVRIFIPFVRPVLQAARMKMMIGFGWHKSFHTSAHMFEVPFVALGLLWKQKKTKPPI